MRGSSFISSLLTLRESTSISSLLIVIFMAAPKASHADFPLGVRTRNWYPPLP
eukprot:CAMPEP_0181362848 /NCGR_PEP_ID=MMETSP1106-20121128/8310_1 /TAXON_ID=81844 /ORGANISM="Mantoniella antarctica, Strain SL-175" /LENGTH=52 /DNA_ID=CAMNT_0023476999 /DNA_START=81 /DNA_END=235 /DNA_ORIENTATION=-